ncbi:MAG: S-adenosyl-methyltransferase [Flavobacteriales bacterium]|nr:S-adenosyl-methyltransferase [Flavobacteriales bacterium]
MSEEQNVRTNWNAGKWLRGSFLADERNAVHWPFLLYLGCLALISIYSAHSADRKVFRIAEMRTELKELKSQYVSTRSQLMNATKLSVVGEKVSERGLSQSDNSAYVIYKEEE